MTEILWCYLGRLFWRAISNNKYAAKTAATNIVQRDNNCRLLMVDNGKDIPIKNIIILEIISFFFYPIISYDIIHSNG